MKNCAYTEKIMKVTTTYYISYFSLLLVSLGMLPTNMLMAATPDKLIVSYSLDSAPIQYQNKDGEADGILIDYWKLWSKKSGIPVIFKGAYNIKAQDMLAEGHADINAGLFANKQREKFMDFSETILRSPYHVYLHNSFGEDANLNKLEKYHVGVTRGSFHEIYMREHYPEVKLALYDGYQDLFKAAEKGEVRAFISQPMYLTYFLKQHSLKNNYRQLDPPLYTHGYKAAVTKGRLGLLKIINRYMIEIKSGEKTAITSKWLGIQWSITQSESPRMLTLSSAEISWLSKHKIIRIGVDPQWPPIEYIDNKRIYSGIASDYVRYLEDALSIETVYDPSLKWDDVVKQVKSGKIDVLPAVSITPEREKYLNFTKPYLRFPYVIFTRNDADYITELDDMAGKVVVVEKNYANHDLLRINHPNIKLLLVDNTEQALAAVSLGEADAYMGNLAVASHMILQTGRTNIKVAAPTPYSNDLAFAVRKDLPEMIGILQKSLDSISVEQANYFKKKWFSISFKHDVDYALLWRSAGIGVFVLFLISLWLWVVRRQKEALRISEERFRLIMNATQEGIWDWNIEKNNVYYNPGFFNMLGYTEEQFPKKFGSWMDLLHPDDYENTKSALNTIIEDCKAHYALEFKIKHKSGQYRNVLATGSLELDQQGKPVRSLGSLTDITEIKEAQEKLQRSEQQLKDIIDTIPLAIIVSDNDGNIIFSNRQTEKEIGSDNSVIGLNMKTFYENPGDRTELFSLYKEKGRVDALPMRYKTLSGKLTEGIISMLPVYFDDSMKNLGVLVNLTERMQMERELLAAKTQADIANKTKSTFLANMSHEIRTPMNAIMGLGHLVLKSDLNERQRDYIEKIQSSSNSLLGIINDILDFSKIEAGKLTIEHTEFQLEEVLENLSSLVSIRAEEKNLEILYSIEPDVPLHLLGDSLRLGQILINLTQNAIKFTEQGVILVKISQLENNNDETQLEFTVKDSGIGIDKEEVPYLFDAFHQADETRTRRFGGTGLGLAICRQLVELMGGEITVKSEPGKGSTFSFKLVFKVVEGSVKKYTNTGFKGKRALVVDDNVIALQILTSMLESFSFNVESASSGLEALDKIHKSTGIEGNNFDLVLIDWKMPGLNGIETCRKIHEQIQQPHIPTLIMITSYGREEIMRQAEQAGLDGFLIKPINPSMLYNCIVGTMLGDTSRREDIPHDLLNKELTGKVLLVDDNAINQQVAQEILENMGLIVYGVTDGMSALKALEDNDFDVVITDIQMPVMDGYELTRQIRHNQKWSTLPIIAMTAHAMAGDREKCLAAGMDDHVPKPVDPQKLFNSLERWMHARQPDETAHNIINTTSFDLPVELDGIDMPWDYSASAVIKNYSVNYLVNLFRIMLLRDRR